MAINNFLSDGGEWNTAGNWSLGTIPVSTDDCTFTGIVTPGAILTITTTGANAKSIDFSGAAIFELSGSPQITIYGSLTCKTGMTWSHTGVLYVAYGAAGTLTSNGVNLSSVGVVRVANAGSLSLGGALNIGAKNLYVFNAGTSFTSNNNTITCSIFGDAGSSGAITITLGSSTINCANVSFAAATLTVTANTATINVTSTVDVTSHLGGVNWNGTSFVYSMTGARVLTLNGANTVAAFSISWTTDSILSALKLGADQVVTGAFSVTGAAVVSRPRIYSSAIGTARTITAATVSITGAVDFQDITGAGAGSWNLSAIKSGNLGGNSGITFRTPANYYLDFGTANAVITDNCWATSSGGGAGGTGVFPLPQDTIVIDNLSWDDTYNTLTLSNLHRIGNLYTADLTENQIIVFGAAVYIYGDLILTGSGLSVTMTSTTLFCDARLKNEATDTIDINCLPSAGSGAFTVGVYEGQVGTVKLVTNNLTHTGTFTLAYGAFDLGGKTLSTNTFSSSSTDTRELKDTVGGGKIVVTGLTGTIFNMATATNLTVSNAPDVDIGTGALTLSADVTFAGGGKTFGDFTVRKHAGNYDCILTG